MSVLTKLLKESYDLQEAEGDKTAYWHLSKLREAIRYEQIKRETSDKQQNSNDFIADVIDCLSSEIEEMHYQKRDRMQCYLQQLLYETKQKGNLAEELISALEMYLNK